MIYIIFILIIISAIAKAVKDTLSHHFYISVFNKFNRQYWNPKISWENKYHKTKEGVNVPKFFGSTTIFVFITDAWHLFQFINQNTLFIAFTLAFYINYNFMYSLIIGVILAIIYKSVFELFYSKIFKV